MNRKLIVLCVLLFPFTQCAQKNSDIPKGTSNEKTFTIQGAGQPVKSNNGLIIEYGPNLGIIHLDKQGVKHFYVHSTAVITNDSIIPINLKAALSDTYKYPSFCMDYTQFKIFLVPKELTPDTATIYNNILNGQHDFLNSPLDTPYVLHKTLNPGEYSVVTIGVLTQMPANCTAVPRAIFSNDTRGLLKTCDRAINQDITLNPLLNINVKLEYFNQRKFVGSADGCVVIPIAQISYQKME